MFDRQKAVLGHQFEQIGSQEGLVLVDTLFASDYLGHAPPDEIHGREGLKQYLSMVYTAFPDLQVAVEDVLAEADKVVIRWRAQGTHIGAFKDLAPTGKQRMVTGISILRMADGKVVECWVSWNAVAEMQQHERRPVAQAAGDHGRT